MLCSNKFTYITLFCSIKLDSFYWKWTDFTNIGTSIEIKILSYQFSSKKKKNRNADEGKLDTIKIVSKCKLLI